MNDKEKNIVSKLDIIENMSNDVAIKQLTQVFKEYIKAKSKINIGFTEDKSE